MHILMGPGIPLIVEELLDTHTHTKKQYDFPHISSKFKTKTFQLSGSGGEKKKGNQKTQLVGSFVYFCHVIISEMSITVSFLN